MYLAVTAVDPLGTPTALSVNGTGFAVPQTTSAFSAPSGTFVFRTQNLNTALGGVQPIANVGVFTVASGAVSAGSEDQLSFGAADSQLSLTGGVFNAPDSLGRLHWYFYLTVAHSLRRFTITWLIATTCISSRALREPLELAEPLPQDEHFAFFRQLRFWE